jgi:hypothetical protein
VIALAASAGEVFAGTEPVNGGLNAARLYESQVGSAKWTFVPAVSRANALTVFGHTVWAGISPKLWRSTDRGKDWSRLSFDCPRIALSPTAVGAASAASVALACSDESYPQPGQSFKEVFTSANGGRTFHLVGQPAEPGNVGMLAMPPGHPRVITLAASSGTTFLCRSVNGGNTWKYATLSDGGIGVRHLAYVSATTGYVIHFSGGPVIACGMGLLRTVNAGASWKHVAIP